MCMMYNGKLIESDQLLAVTNSTFCVKLPNQPRIDVININKIEKS